jgi:tetratricopeptide (TPR) repeat protein
MAGPPDALRAAERYKRLGRLRDAERAYRAVLAEVPGHAIAAAGLADACRRQGRKDDALEVLLRVLPLTPMSIEVTLGLARLLDACNEVEAAIASFERAVQLDATHADARRLLAASMRRRSGPASSGPMSDRLSSGGQLMFARALVRLGRISEAVPFYRSLLARDPSHARGRSELGQVLLDLGQIDAELEVLLEAAATDDPTSAPAQYRLGQAFLHTGRLPEAIAKFKQAHTLDPHEPYLLSDVVYAYTLGADGHAALDEATRWSELYEPPSKAVASLPRSSPRQGDRLRIGYVSPDFCHHVDSYFLLPLLRNHDRARFEVTCYSATRKPDHVTQMLTAHTDRWVSILGESDEKAAARIRQDGVDILVDLKLHSSEHRLGIFSRRAAPVQVCWLSYPGTTGLRAMDYRLTDPHLDPPGAEPAHYSERSVRLADTFWCYERYGPSPPVPPPPMLVAERVTFGSFNRVAKVSDTVLALWARLLRRLPSAKLVVYAPAGSARTRIVSALSSQGVAAERIETVGRQSNEAYLDSYRRIDVVLDTYPYNGATTTLDAFWMGVPVVTLVGPTAGGRAGLSLATNLGLPELIATKPDEYVEIAAGLARDPARLTALRWSLRDRLQSSVLMDGQRFAASVEEAYRAMWREKMGGG